MDFGVCFAYNGTDALPGKSSEGEHNGQEEIEEVEEDPSNETSDGGWLQEVGAICMGPSALRDGARPGNSDIEWQAGPLSKRQRPFLAFAAAWPLRECFVPLSSL
jgi:hypothetical protein